MNMISTGAFLNEMDASNKQPTVAEKFAAVWEKKNAKAARAGGVSLMALSLAACGSSSTTTTTSTDTSTDTTTDTTTPVASPYVLSVATSPDSFTLTSGDDVVDGKTANSFGDKVDVVVDASTTDADVANIFVTAAPTAGSLLQNIETVNVTLGADVTATGVIVGANEINVSATADGHALTMVDVLTGTTFNMVGTTVYGADSLGADLTVDAKTSLATLNLGVSHGGTTTLDINGAGQVEFAVVNIDSTGGTKNTVAIDATTDRETTGDKIVVTGDTDLTISGAWAAFGADTTGSEVETTIDASDATGTVLFANSAAAVSDAILDVTKFTGVDGFVLGNKSTIGVKGANTIADMVSGQSVELAGYANAASTDDLVLDLADASSATDSVSLKLNDAAATANLEIDDLTITGINNVSIESTGALANAAGTALVNSINSVITTTAGTKLTITGDKKLVVDGDMDELITTINASGATGAIDITMADAVGNLTFTGGSGDDRVDMQGRLTYEDSLTGGDGKDTLALVAGTAASTSVLTSTATTGNVNGFSGFEVLELTDAVDLASSNGDVTVDLTKEAGMNELKLSAAVTVAANDTFTVKAESGFTLEVEGGGQTLAGVTAEDDVIISIKDAQSAGTDDVVNFVLDNGTAAITEQGFSIDGVETLNITQLDHHASDIDTIADIHGAQLQTITVTGAKKSTTNAQSITITDLETTSLKTLDASAFTGALDISGMDNNYAATGATIKGSSGVNTINGGSGADNITGGASADTIYGYDGLDTITGGAGGDIIIGDGGGGTKEAVTATIGSNGFSAAADGTSVTIFGATVSKTFVTTTFDTGKEIASGLADVVNNHAILGKLVTAAAGNSGSDGSITVTAKVDGNFTDFDVASLDSAGTISGEGATNGSATADGVDTITAGSGADFIAGGAGADVITLDVDQQTDTIVILAGGLGDKITGFEAGANGSDVLVFANDLTNVGTAAATLQEIASNGTVGANSSYVEITTATAAGGADTAAEIATHLANLNVTNVDDTASEIAMFAVNDGSDTYIWQFTEDATDGVQADDLVLAAHLVGVTDLANGDLAFIA